MNSAHRLQQKDSAPGNINLCIYC